MLKNNFRHDENSKMSIMFWYLTQCVIDAVTSSTMETAQKVKPDVSY